MQTVHIYVETDITAPRPVQRYVGYVLECMTVSGKTGTRERFQKKTGTYHQAILEALIEAVERINQSCEVHIHTQDTFVLDMIGKNLSLWAGNEFRNSKGELVKNHSLWSRLWTLLQRHLIETERGEHPYLNWMQSEMMKRREADSSSIS